MGPIDQIARISQAVAVSGHAVSGGMTSDYDLNSPDKRPQPPRLREAAVLVAFTVCQAELRLILTKRSSALKHHPGQIALPGGKKEASETLLQTALREAEEEVGLPAKALRVLGELGAHETVTGFRVTPYVAYVTQAVQLRPEYGEVAEVFTVPATHILSSARYHVEHRRWRGEQRFYHVAPYGPYYIWGATARMLYTLALQVEGGL